MGIVIRTLTLGNYVVFVFMRGFQIVYGALFLAIGKAKEGGVLSIGRQGGIAK